MALGIAAAAAAVLAPASAQAAGLIAAYDIYVPGKGFEIGLVNIATGQPISVPPAVNTTDDELHPALSPDGRFVVFMRTKLQPKLNGDVVPPAARSLFKLERSTGTVTSLVSQDSPAGPVISGGANLAFGIRPRPNFNNTRTFMTTHGNFSSAGAFTTPSSGYGTSTNPPAGALEITQAALGAIQERDLNTLQLRPTAARWFSQAYLNAAGGLVKGSVQFTTLRDNQNVPQFTQGQGIEFGSETAAASHPFPRNIDNYTALDLVDGNDVDIQTISWPQEQALTVAPEPITTDAPERMPAWSPPDGNQLGFIRTTNARRLLAIFDLTPGIQNPLNAPLDIGAEPPTAQLRSYQNVWGGLSLALSDEGGSPTTTCNRTCINLLKGPLTTVILRPSLSLSTPTQRVGIFVVRVTGKRKLLGRTVPRIKAVGRVPLGKTRKGLNSFRWNGKVAGKRLKPGTYLLTYRALRKDRILGTSDSVRFTVTKSGKFTKVSRQR